MSRFGTTFVRLALAALLVAGCAPSRDSELLRLEEIGPDRVSPGDLLRLSGHGFPTGRTGTVLFEGEARTPGRRPSEVRYTTTGVANSADSVSIRATDGLLSRVGGRATFRGTVRVVFPGAERGTTVSGRLTSVMVDFMPSTRERLEHGLGDSLRGRAVASRLGLAFSDEEPEDGGLVVQRVRPDSPADHMGLRPEDRIVAMDGVRLASLADLLPPPGIHQTELEVARPEAPAPVFVRVPFFVASDAPSAFAIGMAVAIGIVLAVFAFAARTAGFTAWLARRAPAHAEATLVWLFGANERATSRRERIGGIVVVAFGVLGMSIAFAGVAIVAERLRTFFEIGILLSASLALRLVAKLFGTDDDHESPWLSFLVVGVPLTITVTSIGLLVGTGHIAQVQAVQGGWPWQWLVFRHPVAFALFPVFAATALGRVEPLGATHGISKVAARAHLLVVSCLGAMLFLGGTQPPMANVPYAPVLGVAGFVLKCWALIGVGLWLRGVSPGSADDAWKWTVPLAIGGLLATTICLLAEPPTTLEALSGPVLCAVATAVGLYVTWQRARPKDDEELAVFPFL